MERMWLLRPRPRSLPLTVPRPDGSGWPDEGAVGRPSFDGLTFYELACRRAFELDVHDVADRVIDAVLPHVHTDVSAEDEPYLTKVFRTAARVGAAVAMVDRSGSTSDADTIDRHIASALWQARRALPAMRPDWAVLGAYFVLAGYYVARGGEQALVRLVRQLPPDSG